MCEPCGLQAFGRIPSSVTLTRSGEKQNVMEGLIALQLAGHEDVLKSWSQADNDGARVAAMSEALYSQPNPKRSAPSFNLHHVGCVAGPPRTDSTETCIS